MDVNHCWLSFLVQRSNAPMDYRQGQDAQIPPSSDRHVLPQELCRRQRELHQGARGSMDQVRVTGGSRYAITRVPDGEHTRVVAQSGSGQDL
jgi:hypothetical protein